MQFTFEWINNSSSCEMEHLTLRVIYELGNFNSFSFISDVKKKMYSFPLKNNVYILLCLLTQWKNYSIQGLFHNRI